MLQDNMSIFELDEKERLITAGIIAFIIGLSAIIFANKLTLDGINKNYIKQNTAIIGAYLSGGENADDNIIKAVTKGDLSYYEEGVKALEKYNYNINISKDLNPIIKNENLKSYIRIIVCYVIFFAVVSYFISKKFRNIFSYITRLNKKAELIVEGKFLNIEQKDEKFKDDIFAGLNVQFNLMQSRIENNINDLKMEKINLKNIINDISHQLKTPIAAISVYNDILKDQENMDKKDIDYFIKLTGEQIGRMDWLVKTLLKYARLESNVVKYNKKMQSLNETVLNSINTLQVNADEKEISINFISSKDIEIIHDRKWMEEAVLNIIKNAIEHTQKNGEVNIKLIESELFVRIEIEDNGEGIATKDINRIFDRFHKGCNTINPKSIGIGLSLSKNIIENNGGDIKVESTLGKGSKFTIVFLK